MEEEDDLQRQTTDLSSTIEAALEEAEEVVSGRTAIVRRLTAIEDSMKEEEDEVVPTP